MKLICKYFALILALSLCLTALWGCSEKGPALPETDDTQQTDQQQSDLQQTTPELLSDTIVCSDGDTTLRFERGENEEWQWKDDPDFPLDVTYVEKLAACVDQMMAAQPIDTDKTVEDLDLDSDEKYVTVTDEKGHKVTWYLGDKNDDGCYYMRLIGDESDAIYLAPAELTSQISRSIYDMMILPQLPEMAAEYIRSITITAGDKTVTTAPDSSGVWVAGNSSVNEKAQPVVQALGQMQIDSCVDFKPTSGAAAICGLDPAKASIAVEFVNAVGAENALFLSIGAKLGDGYCVAIGEDTTIYLMKASLVEPILAFIQS